MTDNHDSPQVIDPANLDHSISPADDFYRFAVGSWLKNHPIPPEFSSWGSFEQIVEKNRKDLRIILEGAAAEKNTAPGSDSQKIGDFYASGINAVKIERDGLKYLKSYLNRIEQLKGKKDITNCISNFHSVGINTLFQIFVDPDPKNSDTNIVWLYQGGLGLPDRDYYLDKNERFEKIRDEYLRHVTNMFVLMGASGQDASDSARFVMKIETRLAGASMTRLERRDPKATYNKMSLDRLDEIAGFFNFPEYFQYLSLEYPGDINVAQPKFFREIGKMIPHTTLEEWKAYFCWHLILKTAPYLSKAFVGENFRFYGTFLAGTKKLKPRWKRSLAVTSSALGELVGKKYVERYFPRQARDRAMVLVSNLKRTLEKRIKRLDWMSDTTRQKALEKLRALGIKIGYPDQWIDYSSLEISRDSYLVNVLRAENFEFRRTLEKAGKPVDRQEWEMTPQTVNAYYHPFKNEIVFPAAILQPPFFNFAADDAVNYGAIGAVIGHEMIHGFDDQGRQYDKAGNLDDWWTQDDEKRFKERSEFLVKQFNEYVVVDDLHIDGNLTLGENIADLGGLNVAFEALKAALKRNPPLQRINGFTPEQRFFLAWAQVWRNNIREENLHLRLKTDVHSPHKYRTNGPLSNLDAFYLAFNIKPGTAMYRPPGDRIKIW